MKFGSPIKWREPKNHQDDCHFRSIDLAPSGTATEWKVPHFNTPTFLLCCSQCRTAMNSRCQFSHISRKLLHSIQKGTHSCQLRKKLQLIKGSLFQIIRGRWTSLSWMILSATRFWVKSVQKYSHVAWKRFIMSTTMCVFHFSHELQILCFLTMWRAF